ncbi:MAG: galactose-1-phosphate uridylyltransferase [Candidatus Omnitrophica bacterium]|nr:galactose-1-phosphate uridylyltransferase [Candidatus Omnitrophota bacterium]
MPELRKDPVIGRWVIIATERARRPGNFVDPQKNYFVDEEPCPFCHNADQEIYSIKGDDGQWKVKVVASAQPLVKKEVQFNRHGHGLYDVVNSYGVNEIVIETPEHITNMADLDIHQIQHVIEAYKIRFKDIAKEPDLQYALAFKNYGWAAGGRRIGHSRSQIIATSINPLRVKEKLKGAKRHFDYHDRCLYCDLIRQEMSSGKRVVAETEHFIAITPFAPRFPFELTILPKEHHCDFSQGIVGHEEDLAKILKDILSRIKVGLEDPAYNYIIQTAPFNRLKRGDRWQTIKQDYHWHIEVLPRLSLAAGFEKGTGFYICPIPPEDTAEFLREVEV